MIEEAVTAIGSGDTTCTTRPDAWKRALELWQRVKSVTSRAPRRLRLCESLALGERRFVAVVEFEEFRFLLGGTSASLVLLARLDREDVSSDHRDSTSQRVSEENR